MLCENAVYVPQFFDGLGDHPAVPIVLRGGGGDGDVAELGVARGGILALDQFVGIDLGMVA